LPIAKLQHGIKRSISETPFPFLKSVGSDFINTKFMLQFLKNWSLPVAMLIGAVLHPLFIRFPGIASYVSFFTALLIFAMLLLAFCKVSPRDLKITRMHLWMLGFQLVFAAVAYLLLCRLDTIAAQGALVCFIAPTATAAVVITVKLGGNGTTLTSYTMLINVAVAVLVPLVFPLIEVKPNLDFRTAFSLILIKVFPLLIVPFFAAWLLANYLPKVHQALLNLHDLAFYLWVVCIVVVTAQTIATLSISDSNGVTELLLAGVSLVACCMQFFMGKYIGHRYGDGVCGGQALGQKNTILAIWMAHTYLNPISAVGPGIYMLWQNIFNSWQLWRNRTKENDRG
jgi:BASS family bile acid:Na+ symporter